MSWKGLGSTRTMSRSLPRVQLGKKQQLKAKSTHLLKLAAASILSSHYVINELTIDLTSAGGKEQVLENSESFPLSSFRVILL